MFGVLNPWPGPQGKTEISERNGFGRCELWWLDVLGDSADLIEWCLGIKLGLARPHQDRSCATGDGLRKHCKRSSKFANLRACQGSLRFKWDKSTPSPPHTNRKTRWVAALLHVCVLAMSVHLDSHLFNNLYNDQWIKHFPFLKTKNEAMGTSFSTSLSLNLSAFACILAGTFVQEQHYWGCVCPCKKLHIKAWRRGGGRMFLGNVWCITV